MFTTLILFNLCHWAGDFTHLSNAWMLEAKRFGKPILPIAVHAAVHASLFFLVACGLHGFYWGIVALGIQLGSHLLIDIAKGRINYYFPSVRNIDNPYHWWLFGADQFLHQMIIFLIVYLIYHAG